MHQPSAPEANLIVLQALDDGQGVKECLKTD